jgi:hypothetical protein
MNEGEVTAMSSHYLFTGRPSKFDLGANPTLSLSLDFKSSPRNLLSMPPMFKTALLMLVDLSGL